MNRIKLLTFFIALAIVIVACGCQESPTPTTAPTAEPVEEPTEAPIEDPGSFPFPYEVSYDPSDIVENHTYTMRVRIEGSDGSLLFINDTAIPVITNGNPTEDVEIPVIQVGG